MQKLIKITGWTNLVLGVASLIGFVWTICSIFGIMIGGVEWVDGWLTFLWVVGMLLIVNFIVAIVLLSRLVHYNYPPEAGIYMLIGSILGWFTSFFWVFSSGLLFISSYEALIKMRCQWHKRRQAIIKQTKTK